MRLCNRLHGKPVSAISACAASALVKLEESSWMLQSFGALSKAFVEQLHSDIGRCTDLIVHLIAGLQSHVNTPNVRTVLIRAETSSACFSVLLLFLFISIFSIAITTRIWHHSSSTGLQRHHLSLRRRIESVRQRESRAGAQQRHNCTNLPTSGAVMILILGGGFLFLIRLYLQR